MNPQMMNPIIRRLLAMKMMQGGGVGGPGMLDPGMDPGMSRMPPMGGPGGTGPDMDMDFPQGDADYEAQEARLARPQLVHSMPEMAKQYGGNPPPEAREMTGMMERAPQGPIKERLHADQHGMMRRHKSADLSIQRMTLAQKKAQLMERIRMLKETGRTDELQRILGVLQKQGITLDQMLGDEPQQ